MILKRSNEQKLNPAPLHKKAHSRIFFVRKYPLLIWFPKPSRYYKRLSTRHIYTLYPTTF